MAPPLVAGRVLCQLAAAAVLLAAGCAHAQASRALLPVAVYVDNPPLVDADRKQNLVNSVKVRGRGVGGWVGGGGGALPGGGGVAYGAVATSCARASMQTGTCPGRRTTGLGCSPDDRTR